MSDKKLPKEAVYYAEVVKFSFRVPVRSKENDEVVVKVHPQTGHKLLDNTGAPIIRTKLVQGQTISNNPKLGYLSIVKTSDPDEIEVLEKLAGEPIHGLFREMDYKKRKNPEAFKHEVEKIALQEKVVKLDEENSKKDAAIESLQAQVRKMTEDFNRRK